MVRRDLVASMIGVLVGLALSWLALATAQGGDQTPESVTWGPQKPTPAAQGTVFGVLALMWSAGCKDGEKFAFDPGQYEMGTCTMGGDEVTVAVFAPGAAQSRWVDSMTEVGAIVVEGDRWAVASLDATAPVEFAAAVPGTPATA